MRICILGAGQWGRCVAALLEEKGYDVEFRHHTDRRWPQPLDALLLALPVQHFRQTLVRFPPPACPILSLAKGLELPEALRPSEIVRQVWGENTSVGALSGPNFASEIAQRLPTAAVVAAEREEVSLLFQRILHCHRYRVYRSTDLIGVELAGALKNVYAIAGGICVGLGLGDNALASLLTRSLAEMTRLGRRLGARPATFRGLAGVGDLFLTGTSDQSRNRRLGKLVAQGLPVDLALQRIGSVVEGYPTTKSVVRAARFENVRKPIATEVYQILYEGKPPKAALSQLVEPIPEQEEEEFGES
ncbi:NAD(P)H-dependent glycerol-3-phosphate dehydrogenase [Candidatus Methylacidithermus pantelleriae]|uniref:Glycerol-3-phosphate dehydrogenase [NAD(P)+] n=1 Tax=Candidatus Methylacidithermus pantelleriae TaxID=2744239 RepID=A0A8J2BLX6_9BACT|nr:NAD(P)H-dependent glycerol-3-phosphate dehydrogenase [Candidatus Methylacidithermus pantelleriae]CAF0689731.1 Glycerol-3-phosphate dehydrogenase (NAD(P)+) [Candidatus Methylacidithermus pantelleriae]